MKEIFQKQEQGTLVFIIILMVLALSTRIYRIMEEHSSAGTRVETVIPR